MNFFQILIFSCILLLCYTLSSSDFPEEEGQILLSSETFPLALETFQNMLVFFYKENDEKCEDFYQFFQKITSSKEGEEEIKISSIDIEEENELLNKKEYGISGQVPQVLLYVRGHPIEYDGGASLFFLRRWLKQRLSPKTRGIGSIDDLDYFLKKFLPNQVKYIFVGANQAPAQLFLDFTIFLKRWEHVAAGHVMPKFGEVYKEVIRRYLPEKIGIDENDDEQSAVLMFRGDQFESHLTIIYNSSFWNLIYEFETNGIPKVWFYDEFAKERFFQLNKTFLLFITNNSSEFQSYAKTVQQKYQGKIEFSIAQIEANHDTNNIISALGIENSTMPIIFIINPMGRYENYEVWQKYKYNENLDINLENLCQFIDQYLDGKLQKYLKSEKLENMPPLSIKEVIPEHSIRLSSDYFEQFFEQFLPQRSILVLFRLDNYCPYSKLLFPIFEQITKLLHQKLGDELICINYNPTTNELKEELQWFDMPKGFPAIWMIKKDPEAMTNKQINYIELPVNERTANGIFQLVKKQIEIKQDIEQEILNEINNLDISLQQFEDPLDSHQTINIADKKEEEEEKEIKQEIKIEL